MFLVNRRTVLTFVLSAAGVKCFSAAHAQLRFVFHSVRFEIAVFRLLDDKFDVSRLVGHISGSICACPEMDLI